MVIRISAEGQYRLASSYLDRINEIDNKIVEAIASGERDAFSKLFNELLALVRTNGERVADDELVESQVVLPPADTTFDEAAELFVAEGLVPD
ncbi:MAG TPA: hypothetical protein VHA53_03880 [Nitrolancea sp.]|jgi:hypothetical protein|nr:hypothetical protein [Nitrolancea sp.]